MLFLPPFYLLLLGPLKAPNNPEWPYLISAVHSFPLCDVIATSSLRLGLLSLVVCLFACLCPPRYLYVPVFFLFFSSLRLVCFIRFLVFVFFLFSVLLSVCNSIPLPFSFSLSLDYLLPYALLHILLPLLFPSSSLPFPLVPPASPFDSHPLPPNPSSPYIPHQPPPLCLSPSPSSHVTPTSFTLLQPSLFHPSPTSPYPIPPSSSSNLLLSYLLPSFYLSLSHPPPTSSDLPLSQPPSTSPSPNLPSTPTPPPTPPPALQI